MYQQISVHGFSLSRWFADNGRAAYLRMLESVATLVASNRLLLKPVVLECIDRIDGLRLNELLKAAVSCHCCYSCDPYCSCMRSLLQLYAIPTAAVTQGRGDVIAYSCNPYAQGCGDVIAVTAAIPTAAGS